ncbi:MAG: sodium/proline symporter [Planctomycetota bacterium]|nr:sodium/proline symporter [Planctomycetota bacterium]
MTSLIVTLVFYKVVLLSIGYWALKRSHDDTDFYLGGRGLGPWVASISSAASSSSAWTLLGVSGAAYTYGMSAIYIFPACMAGFVLNWYILARPMRELSLAQGSVTLTALFADGAKPKVARAISLSASVIILLSLGVYVASQFQAAGKTFAETLNMDFSKAVLIGGGIVFLYTLSGGFWAASVSDLIQGLVMASAAVIVPLFALIEVGGLASMYSGLGAVDPALLDFTRGKSGMMLVAFIIGTLGIGLGYPGQPHVVNRFMALRSDDDVKAGAHISIGWGIIIYSGMLISGWCGRVLVDSISDNETVLLKLTTELFNPVVSGVIIAAVLSAIMSTADSQLLVCASTISHDIPKVKRNNILLDRLAIFIISSIAITAALFIDETIFNTVLFAWSALGAAFGPLLLCRVLRGPVSGRASLLAIWSGFLVTLIWYFTPQLKDSIYELIPAFAIALIPAWWGSRENI